MYRRVSGAVRFGEVVLIAKTSCHPSNSSPHLAAGTVWNSPKWSVPGTGGGLSSPANLKTLAPGSEITGADSRVLTTLFR